MHTYRNMGDHWCVGFRREGPVVRFEEIKDFPTEDEAAAYVSLLNGGAVGSTKVTPDAPDDGRYYARQGDQWVAIPPTAMIDFEYSFNTSTEPPPGGGQVRLNNPDQTAATKIWLDYTTSPGVDVANFLNLVSRGIVFIQDKDDATKLQRYNVIAGADKGTYLEIDVQWVSGKAPLTAQRAEVVLYTWVKPAP